MKTIINILAFLILVSHAFSARAIAGWGPSFGDCSATSPSGRYKVEAKKPHNSRKPGEPNRSDSIFTYTCYDTQAKKLLWSRKQATAAPKPTGKDEPIAKPPANEPKPINVYSPVEMYVSDSGWTAVRELRGDLTWLNSAGESRQIRMIEEALTPEEKEQKVCPSDVGPIWMEYSIWYFLDVDQAQLFVVRPWWGRRIVVDLGSGRLLPVTESILNAAAPVENAYVIKQLGRGSPKPVGSDYSKYNAAMVGAYLAGALKITEAIPRLRELEKSDIYSGSVGRGATDQNELENPAPYNFEPNPLRQFAQLSLRRLAQTPCQLPVYGFEIYHKGEIMIERGDPLKVARDAVAAQVATGMGTKAVLSTIGSPDLVDWDSRWHYDIDAAEPYTLILTWEETRLVDIERISPPEWKSGLDRDENLVQ